LEIKVKKLELQLEELRNAKLAIEVSFNDADKKNKELKKIVKLTAFIKILYLRLLIIRKR
jgi:hypothetical protein